MQENELRSRSTLHINSLPEFKAWLEGRGWEDQELKDPFEALRMTKQGKYGRKILLVHRKLDATEPLTTWGTSAVLVKMWLREKSREKEEV